ncbi:hypothetical protein AWB71_04535 [Caballeronia peredens]|nr:hypothetical protein AWB71_04535 [Caballeronia peredens]
MLRRANVGESSGIPRPASKRAIRVPQARLIFEMDGIAGYARTSRIGVRPHCSESASLLKKIGTVVATIALLNAQGVCAATIQSSRPPYVASISGDALTAITIAPQALKLDMNARNSIRSETGDFKPARYSFPDARVPSSVLRRLTDIYRYDRRRDVPIVSSGGDWVVAEYFAANSHSPAVRFRLLGKRVQRQERLDHAGRTTKLVVVGWANMSARDDNNDNDYADLSALGPHPAWIRVFDVSRDGKQTLVALAWRKRAFTKSPESDDEPADADLAFGTPGGTLKWRTKAEFLKANGIDLNAESLSGKR